MNEPRAAAHLRPGLGAWGAVLVTIGSIVGTGIFLAPADAARAVHSPFLLLAACVTSGLLTIAGAITYAELGGMFPRAGGIYHFLKEAYGPAAGFLYGWTAFLVIMSGGIAAIAIGAATYLGVFLPWASPEHVLATTMVFGRTWTLSGTQVTAAGTILALTVINHMGLHSGARLQQALVVGAILAIAALIWGAFCGAVHPPEFATPTVALPAGFGVAMVAMLWTFDGWYGLTFSAGELRNPRRDLPRGLVFGTLVVMVLYVLCIAAYVRVLPIDALGAATRPAEAAAAILYGARGARAVSAVALISALGCLASTILYSSRLYQPMASDGLFFRTLASINPKRHISTRSLWAQSGWAIALALTGTYTRLYTFTTCAVVLFHVATAVAVPVLRRARPGADRPYRAWGYPVVPVLFVIACLLLFASAVRSTPGECGAAVVMLVLGLPAYRLWRRTAGS